jgi:UDP-N-acetylmuramate dehydrogenase
MKSSTPPLPLNSLRAAFGERFQENVGLSNYTTARVGGPADGMLVANSAADLEFFIRRLWDLDTAFFVLGSGSNVLVSDAGFRGVVILNRARNIKIDAHPPCTVWAESGANLGGVARQVALRGFSGLEWAATVPGSVGGAVYGNAGAHASDMHKSLLLAEILHRESGKQEWPVERMEYAYRSSALKRQNLQACVLSARLKLVQSTPEEVKARMEKFSEQRRSTQPPGATMGSMFKNPPGDYAGRLIEAAGLKGARAGDAEISPIHANFFVNQGAATAADIYTLIRTAQEKVLDQFGICLELEVERIGDWSSEPAPQSNIVERNE